MNRRKTLSDLTSITENFKKNMESMKESLTGYSKPLPKTNDIWIDSSGEHFHVITVFRIGLDKTSEPFILYYPIDSGNDIQKSDADVVALEREHFIKGKVFAFNIRNLFSL